MRFDSPNTVYLIGPLLGEFIIDYCADKHIYCDQWIFNMAFGTETSYSENSAIDLIERTAALWNLRSANAKELEKRQ